MSAQLGLSFPAPDRRPPSSILVHSLWTALSPYFNIEKCAGDGVRAPRFRIELRSLPGPLYVAALSVRVACCACGEQIQPIRSRRPPGNKRSETIGHSLYYACACPLGVNIGCSRGAEARSEYQRIKAAIEVRQ